MNSENQHPEEDLGDGRIKRWKSNPDGNGGIWVIDKKDVDRSLGVPINCPVCEARWIKLNPEAYSAFVKWNCCDKCVIEHVEGNEERWKSGWRPSKEQVKFWLEKRLGANKSTIF